MRGWIVLLAATLLAAGAACGSDDGATETAASATASPVNEAPLGERYDGPASRYAPQLDEVPGFLVIDAEQTFPVGESGFWVLGPFQNTVEAQRLTPEWGYESGYRIQFAPDGLLAGVMLGRYYATVEVYVFETPEGARAAYQRFFEVGEQPEGVRRLEEVSGIGDEAAGWEVVQGTVGDSNVPATHHRVLLRRGNVIAVVTTFAAQPYADPQHAIEMARIVDERIVGTRPSPTPTPFPTPGGLPSGS